MPAFRGLPSHNLPPGLGKARHQVLLQPRRRQTTVPEQPVELLAHQLVEDRVGRRLLALHRGRLGPLVRSRLVARGIAWGARHDVNAGTPPLAAVRLLLSLAACRARGGARSLRSIALDDAEVSSMRPSTSGSASRSPRPVQRHRGKVGSCGRRSTALAGRRSYGPSACSTEACAFEEGRG